MIMGVTKTPSPISERTLTRQFAKPDDNSRFAGTDPLFVENQKYRLPGTLDQRLEEIKQFVRVECLINDYPGKIGMVLFEDRNDHRLGFSVLLDSTPAMLSTVSRLLEAAERQVRI